MAVVYETIRPEVERLRNYVLNDLDLLVNQDAGGNYLAASLITCACDAISYLKYGRAHRGDIVFSELLPDFWKPVANTFYDAIRDGIVHIHETKTIVVGSKRLNVVISWKAKPHLHVSSTKADVYVNVRQLAKDLKSVITRFEEDLKSDTNLRETFYKSMQRDREIHVRQSDKAKWHDALSRAPKEAI